MAGASNHEGQWQMQLEEQQTQMTQSFVNQVIKFVFLTDGKVIKTFKTR